MALLFDTFRKMMDRLPPVALRKAAAVQCRILEEDIALGREDPVGDVASVLAFCRFLRSAPGDRSATFQNVPSDHLSFYAKIVHKLVAAGELSDVGQKQFDGHLSGIPVETAD